MNATQPQPVACPGSTQPPVLPRPESLSVAYLLAPAGAGRRRYVSLATWAKERQR